MGAQTVTLRTMTPQALAEACAEAMWRDDGASQGLGMRIERIAPGEAVLSFEVTGAMTNGHGTGHGGFIFALADSAFAFACNTYNRRTVAQHCAITYIRPAAQGDRLTASASETARFGRSGIYDIRIVNQNGEHIAQFRGHSRTVKGALLDGAQQA